MVNQNCLMILHRQSKADSGVDLYPLGITWNHNELVEWLWMYVAKCALMISYHQLLLLCWVLLKKPVHLIVEGNFRTVVWIKVIGDAYVDAWPCIHGSNLMRNCRSWSGRVFVLWNAWVYERTKACWKTPQISKALLTNYVCFNFTGKTVQ